MAKLSDPITMLKGVGEVRAKQLAQLNIFTLRDLICHFPRGYEDRTKLVPIEKLEPDVPACFRAMVMNTPRTSHIRKGLDLTKVQVADTTGRLNVTFFNSRFAAQQLEYGREYIFYGAVSGDFIGYSMTNPVFEAPESQPVTTRRILPIYPLTAGLTNAALLRLVQQALAVCDPPEEILPAEVREKYGILPAERAYFAIHEPNSMAEAELAKKRMIFEEFFVFSAGLSLMRAARKKKKTEPYTDFDMAPFYDSLPFTLTGAQSRAVGEILEDFRRGIPMNRLVQGDVGSGKTLVALMSMLLAVDNGFQACMMAPTEILARQHYATFRRMLEGMDVRVAILTGASKARERREALAGIADGSIDLLIGTHALIEDRVQFSNLGFVVIDEQHRFGVEQRARLWTKNEQPPHILVMTATPIPRTLAMTLYGDLDVSVIDELPPGRQPIRTVHYTDAARLRLFGFMRQEIKKGRQIYVVYPLIKESETMDYKDLQDGYEAISRDFPLPEYVTTICHGKMKPEDKEESMRQFKSGEANIMVATSVIEVGVDVPNATVMVIESAERFGLSQLHQLRGRVGRGSQQSYCILMSGEKLSKEARLRLEAMCETNDGFRLAELDLKLRGAGDVNGTLQSGMAFDLKIANPTLDSQILTVTREAAAEVLTADPTLAQNGHEGLRELRKRYSGREEIDFSQIS